MLERKNIALIILMTFFLMSYSYSQGFLRRQNTDIINNNGPLLLKGLNLGNWIVEEGYIMGINKTGYKSPTEFKAAVKDVVGTDSNVIAFLNVWRDNYVKKRDIDSIASKGFNSVRLPFHYNMFYDTSTSSLSSYGFKYIDSALSWCAANKLYLIIDMHCAPGAQSQDYHSDTDGTAWLWTDYTKNKNITTKIWKWIANHYKNEIWIGGYDLINEPVITNSSDNWKLRDLYVAISDSIRTVDSNHLIIAEGNFYGSDFSNLTPGWDANMAYSIHNYWTDIPAPNIDLQKIIATNENLPLWLGESGENSNAWYNSEIMDLEARNIGWCWWLHKKLNSITSPYSVSFTVGYQQIINYWSGTAPKPSQANAYAWLIEMAQQTSLANCKEQKDVLDALLRSNFVTTAIPFKQNTFPGKLYAVDYDMGNNNIASKDNIYQTIAQGVKWTDWNNGWAFRNDGIDIQYSNDQGGNYFVVGWIETGEWLSYTVNVTQSGNYDFQIRLATTNSGATFHIEMNGVNVTDIINVPNTGGWTSWQTISVNNISLLAGKKTLKIVIDNGGFNLNYLNAYTTTTSIESKQYIGNAYIYPSIVDAVDGKVDLFLETYINDEANLSIYDSKGVIVSVEMIQLKSGSMNIPILLANKGSGIYTVVLIYNSNQVYRSKVILY